MVVFCAVMIRCLALQSGAGNVITMSESLSAHNRMLTTKMTWMEDIQWLIIHRRKL
ncbi:hypothetical protein JOC58_002160 [Paenibacillus hunanensis]|uniref:Uncharacterized protein n=1 Tax=Paenibacillus hunanensis TaxID=539262 RepID=A0ABU1IZX6_9BACL|nr:hypothetical protein [Paenibacillus hunanensis]